jgi:hypothetical protein
MSVANCPHCTAPVPAAFASMPVCTICGGDLNATAAAPVWASVDIRTDNTRTCHNCGEKIKSILALECPSCKSEIAPAGKAVEDIEKEKAEFEKMVTASNTKAEPEPVKQNSQPQEQVKAEFKSSTSNSEVKPYPQQKKESKEDFVSIKSKQKKKESFFVKLLRMLGFKKN